MGNGFYFCTIGAVPWNSFALAFFPGKIRRNFLGIGKCLIKHGMEKEETLMGAVAAELPSTFVLEHSYYWRAENRKEILFPGPGDSGLVPGRFLRCKGESVANNLQGNRT